MAERTLSNPAVEIGNVSVGIVPNSLSYKTGAGDIVLRPQSAGGNSIEVIKTENAETKKSMVKFSLFNTKTNIDFVRLWQDSVDGESIQLSDGAYNESFRNMFVMIDPEVNLGAEGNIEVVFEGSPVK
jgi:hypothetical protein